MKGFEVCVDNSKRLCPAWKEDVRVDLRSFFLVILLMQR